jgi:hypothetical protein
MPRVLSDHSASAANLAVTPMQGLEGKKGKKAHQFLMVFWLKINGT